MKEHLKIFDDRRELVDAAAELATAAVRRAVTDRGRCAIALAGGSTPRDLYIRLAAVPRQQIPWEKVHLFWGDERCVAPDHADSNFRMVRETLLDHIALPENHVHRMRGELPPQTAAAHYHDELRGFFGELPPRFDLVLLGMGDDGHTASLFPGTTALQERQTLAAAVHVPALQAWRITLTLPVLNAAREVVFLVAGTGKAAMIARIAGLASPDSALPASLVRPGDGEVHWLLDSDAAAQLGEAGTGDSLLL